MELLKLSSNVNECQPQALTAGHRAGFFLGDGAGVGKGRQIAGLVYEHLRSSGRRALWVSVSTDLKFDAERDLKAGAYTRPIFGSTEALSVEYIQGLHRVLRKCEEVLGRV